MKKEISIILFYAILIVFSSCNECGNKTKPVENDTTVVKHQKHGGFLGDTTIFNSGPRSKNVEESLTTKSLGTAQIKTVTNKYPDTLDRPTAKTLISKYKVSDLTDNNNYFTIDAVELKTFLTDANQNTPSSYLELLLAYENPAHLQLIITAVNAQGDNIYLKFVDGNENVLRISSSLSSQNPFANPSSTPPQSRSITELINCLDIASANEIVNAYKSNTSKAYMTKSFLVKSDAILDLINKVSDVSLNLKNINFYLGQDSNELVMIVVFSDNANNILYFNGGSGNPSLYEHCYPCPPCRPIANNGSQIE